jgi:hypothetical protein
MIGALIAFALLAFAFAAGYATRAFVSQRRRTRYLLYQPYLPRGTRVEADARGDDLASLPAEPALDLPDATASPPATVTDQDGLDELLQRMEREANRSRRN